ncbi:S-ribosylhomocysteine lyase [Hutsoniella sourekii]|uniref:S-ribosylhomocysteine lyase n=1 Tax=Hutsoniella sourekii TaxID=87650 RepID=UPI0004860536|nr:S-ribosylhomocysteine lyase [Hutsoniella sourekii]
MEKIASFTINHEILDPGLYLSREDQVGDRALKSYDLRVVAPNRELVMNTGEMHTIEHLGATYLRNSRIKDEVIYFGPMGCRTGFYLIVTDAVEPQELLDILRETFEFVANYEGDIPGASARDCGNYLDHNLPMANYFGKKYLETLTNWEDLTFSYKD